MRPTVSLFLRNGDWAAAKSKPALKYGKAVSQAHILMSQCIRNMIRQNAISVKAFV
jgi:hypothetical protein